MKKFLLFLASTLFLGMGSAAAQTENPDLYLVGIGGNWTMPNDYMASYDNGTYTWDFTASALKLDAGANFKIAAYSGTPGSSTQWGTPNLGTTDGAALVFEGNQASVVLSNSSVSNNIKMPNAEVSVTKIEVAVADETYTLTVTGTQGQAVDPADVPLYIRGDINEWLNDATAIDQKWQGTLQDDNVTYVWDWSSEAGGYLLLTGTFKFAGTSWDIHNYGAQSTTSAEVTELISNYTASGTENFNAGETGVKVVKMTFNRSTKALNFTFYTEPVADEKVYIVLNGTEYELTSTVTETTMIYALNPSGEITITGDVYIKENSAEGTVYGGAASADEAVMAATEYKVTKNVTISEQQTALIPFKVPENSNWILTNAVMTSYPNEGGVTLEIELSTASSIKEQEAAGIYVTPGTINSESEIQIFTLDGSDVTAANGSLSGVYIVKQGNESLKVLVD